MLTRPTPEQKCYLPPPNSSAIAINFVICEPLKLTQLLDYHSSEASMKRNGYSIEKKLYTPLRTYDTNNCIDFLPHHEYALFRVVPFIHEGDPENRLQLHPHPQKVIVFQGPPMATQSYSFASPTELALPQPGAHTFPIIRNEYGNNIICNPVNNAPYDSTTVQILFTQQPAVPMSTFLQMNPAAIPLSANDYRFNNKYAIHHIASDPKCIPFSLAMRLVQVYTIKPPSKRVYRAWALPHAEDALQGIHQIHFQNRFSYFMKRTEHPEYLYFESQHANSPVNHETGESACKMQKPIDIISGGVDLSLLCSQNSCLNLNEDENKSDSITPEIRYHQQSSSPFTGQHKAFLAVQTRRSSFRPPPPASNDPQTDP